MSENTVLQRMERTFKNLDITPPPNSLRILLRLQ